MYEYLEIKGSFQKTILGMLEVWEGGGGTQLLSFIEEEVARFHQSSKFHFAKYYLVS